MLYIHGISIKETENEFQKLLSICKRSKAYFLYDLPDGEQMLSNGSCGYILYGHPEYTPETLRMVADLAEDDSVIMTRMPKADLPLADQCPNEEYAALLDTCTVCRRRCMATAGRRCEYGVH